MPTIGTAVAIIDGNRILLIKREDFEVWGPTGAVRQNGARGFNSNPTTRPA